MWLIAHKILKAMTDKGVGYCLARLVEMDNSFLVPKGRPQDHSFFARLLFIERIEEKNILGLRICRWSTMLRPVELRLFCGEWDADLQLMKGRILWMRYGRMASTPMEER